MTKKQAEKKFKGLRNLKITTDENGFVTDVSCTIPCIVCGKYHHMFSKVSEKCALKIIIGVRNVLMDGE